MFEKDEIALITRTLRTRTFELHDQIRAHKAVRDDEAAAHFMRGNAAVAMDVKDAEIEKLEGIIETLLAL